MRKVLEDLYNRVDAGQAVNYVAMEEFKTSPLLYHEKLSGERAPRGFKRANPTWEAYREKATMNDKDFAGFYLVSDGPINERTGSPYGKETKAFAEWTKQQGVPANRIMTTADYSRIEFMHSMLLLQLINDAKPSSDAGPMAQALIDAFDRDDNPPLIIEAQSPDLSIPVVAHFDLQFELDGETYYVKLRPTGRIDGLLNDMKQPSWIVDRWNQYVLGLSGKSGYNMLYVVQSSEFPHISKFMFRQGQSRHTGVEDLVKRMGRCFAENDWPLTQFTLWENF